MRVVFRSKSKKLFDELAREFWLAKEFDDTEQARLAETGDAVVFWTDTGSKWVISRDANGEVYLSFEGKREELIQLYPFKNLVWIWWSNYSGQLGVVEEWENVLYIDPHTGDEYEEEEQFPKRILTFYLEVIEYETETPKEWDVWWYEDIKVRSTYFIKAIDPQAIAEKLQSKDGYIAFIGSEGSTPRVIIPCKDQCGEIKNLYKAFHDMNELAN